MSRKTRSLPRCNCGGEHLASGPLGEYVRIKIDGKFRWAATTSTGAVRVYKLLDKDGSLFEQETEAAVRRFQHIATVAEARERPAWLCLTYAELVV